MSTILNDPNVIVIPDTELDSKSALRIIHISDTHNNASKLDIPQCDFLLHTGDFTEHSRFGQVSLAPKEIKKFDKWIRKEILAKDIARYVVVIAGNHDVSLDVAHPLVNSESALAARALLQTDGKRYIYLEHESVTIEGLRIFGSPYTPEFGTHISLSLSLSLYIYIYIYI